MNYKAKKKKTATYKEKQKKTPTNNKQTIPTKTKNIKKNTDIQRNEHNQKTSTIKKQK